ncbi:MAG: Smr/MutS family protein [Gammaproteobacteria bacterium]|nr:Smr/MutS family protein [Gammaproteobacteria bacterium]
MDTKPPKSPPSPPKVKAQISEEEALLFRSAMKKIQPIKKSNKTLLKKIVVRPRPREIFSENESVPLLSDNLTEKIVAPEGYLFFVKPGISPKQIRKLRHGKIPIAATLDLHGFDSESARDALITFLEMAYQKNKRSIIIIHGKGHTQAPVLKNKINNWLRQLENVLAFCTATSRHGSTGALYVLLKKLR